MEAEGRNRGLALGGLALIDSSDTEQRGGAHPALNDGSLVRIVADEVDGVLAVEALLPVGELKRTYGRALVLNKMLIDRSKRSDKTVLVPDFNEDRDYLWVREDGLRAAEDSDD